MRPADYSRLDGLALASLLRKGETSAFELMTTAVQLARERAMPLNALCYPRFEEALEMARTAQLIGPFGGLPFLLKDSGLASRRLPSSMGSRMFRDTQFSFDSTLVERFEAAGFISFARTTVPELCMAPTTEAVANGGPTLNPWDPARSPGGSSGGSAVAVALGVVPIAHGSDGGGSIRIPASCCGVFGLKPSRGLLPMGPARGEGWGGLATDGVITRTVRDTAAVLDAIAGFDPGAPYAAPRTPESFLAGLGKPFDRPLRVAKWVSTWNDIPVDADCLAAVDLAERLLTRNGHEVIDVGPPEIDFDRFVNSLINVIAANAVVSIETVAGDKASEQWRGLLEPAILGAYHYGKKIRASDYISAIACFHQISREMARYMRGFDLVLTPTLTQLPVKLGTLSMDDDFLAFRLKGARYTMFLAIINASGQPAANVPLYWNEQGIPAGVQLIGRFGDDDTVLRASAELERLSAWQTHYVRLHMERDLARSNDNMRTAD
ncbi:amidase [Pseudomonas sp. BN102]|uniref:amidase n=1 Tax=Pseudomonas sp. BN102 TaxID=2567886 RepID=UPI002453887E|nr:amidase [Pseudomonas sp. BN102]MDH4608817.1 amidase [Pseudomonas sp. BN102]